jgi:hypothetical protein
MRLTWIEREAGSRENKGVTRACWVTDKGRGEVHCHGGTRPPLQASQARGEQEWCSKMPDPHHIDLPGARPKFQTRVDGVESESGWCTIKKKKVLCKTVV